jgi:hypothetical protein
MKLAAVGLVLAALAAPARAGRVVPDPLANLNGLHAVSGLSAVKGVASSNGLSQLNGLCPSSLPCSSGSVTTSIAIWTASDVGNVGSPGPRG